MEVNENVTNSPTPFADTHAAGLMPVEAPLPALKLVARGLSASERLLLDGLVRMSQRDTRRRTQPLELLQIPNERDADVVLVDARDVAAVAWAQQQAWLASTAVIWIDAAQVPDGHTLTRRPVQWPVLPILLARAIEQHARLAPPAPVGLRAAAVLPPQTHAAAAQPLAMHRPARLLVVDDSPMVRLQLRTLLSQRGTEVTEADDVPMALHLLREREFDGVLMDVLMPGTDGYDGCRQIKSLLRGGKSVPVVMLTSKSSPFDRIRGKMAGCDAYLTKPVDPERLNEVLFQHVRGMQAGVTSPVAARSVRPLFPSTANLT